ncbi:hypothetical protein B0T11DRAFT_105427 [Plectosphaerella cucumerina]|uniref:Secreted protein n=1 Tax=Plectosphaerella cucumerina TaxID=40658 RepID=A0A8K0X2L3_9PEZI|nr:hypothetical protein B0T11DRAFT_105427 [Plectosphaerella cucumerina]
MIHVSLLSLFFFICQRRRRSSGSRLGVRAAGPHHTDRHPFNERFVCQEWSTTRSSRSTAAAAAAPSQGGGAPHPRGRGNARGKTCDCRCLCKRTRG